jgi:hypothetical protein
MRLLHSQIVPAAIVILLLVPKAVFCQNGTAAKPAIDKPEIQTAAMKEDGSYWKLRAIEQEINLIQTQFAELLKQREEAIRTACMTAGAVNAKKEVLPTCAVSWKEKVVRWTLTEPVVK